MLVRLLFMPLKLRNWINFLEKLYVICNLQPDVGSSEKTGLVAAMRFNVCFWGMNLFEQWVEISINECGQKWLQSCRFGHFWPEIHRSSGYSNRTKLNHKNTFLKKIFLKKTFNKTNNAKSDEKNRQKTEENWKTKK